MPVCRRTLLAATAVLGGAVLSAGSRAQEGKTYRAGVIGRTGAGGFGHGYDRIFTGLPNVSVEAIADVDADGLKKAAERSGAKRSYLDFHEMLAKEKLDLVCVASRQPNIHRELAVPVLESGAHLLIEKPLSETLEDADAIIEAAEKRKRKIAIAHVLRYSRQFHHIKALIDEGFLGTPVEVRGFGAQDGRFGGDDMIVLGTHEMDIIRWYFGDPLWCWAAVTVGGRDITQQDVRRGPEELTIAGDSVRATYALPNNVLYHWSSMKTPDRWRSRRGFTIFGTRRIIAFYHGASPPATYLDSPLLPHTDEQAIWKPLPQPQGGTPPYEGNMAKDLIRAIETDTQPLASGYDGRWAIEMVAAAYESQRTKSRVEFPLKERRHPLALLRE